MSFEFERAFLKVCIPLTLIMLAVAFALSPSSDNREWYHLSYSCSDKERSYLGDQFVSFESGTLDPGAFEDFRNIVRRKHRLGEGCSVVILGITRLDNGPKNIGEKK